MFLFLVKNYVEITIQTRFLVILTLIMFLFIETDILKLISRLPANNIKCFGGINMKKLLMKALKFTSCFALLLTVLNVNAACGGYLHQAKVPECAMKYKK